LSPKRLAACCALALLVLTGCPPPDYVPVGLHVDLQVSADADPFEGIRGVRVCLTSDAGGAFYLYPSDPGTFLVPEVPGDMLVSLEIQGIDLEPDEIEIGEDPAILAHASVTDAPLSIDGDAGYVTAAFALCGDDCPADCGQPDTLPMGEDSIGVRRVLLDSP